MELYEAKKLLHSNGSCQRSEKAAYWVGEDLCKWYIWKGVNIQNIQRTHTAQHQKKNLILKRAEGLNKHFPKIQMADIWKDAEH